MSGSLLHTSRGHLLGGAECQAHSCVRAGATRWPVQVAGMAYQCLCTVAQKSVNTSFGCCHGKATKADALSNTASADALQRLC